MDHDVVVRDNMTEKYLLEELDPALRYEFEEHFFDCPECAGDVHAASEFVEHSKIILAEQPVAVLVPGPPHQDAPRAGWFAWFRPALAIPTLAVLLVVIAYQNFVTLPQLTESANQPQLLPAATVNLLTYGSNTTPLMIHQGQGFLVNVIIPPGRNYSTYRVDLYNPSGTMEASLPVPASAGDTWPIRFPGSKRQSGTYKLLVHGIAANRQDTEVGSSSFELQIQR
jgi:hypothetical protein